VSYALQRLDSASLVGLPDLGEGPSDGGSNGTPAAAAAADFVAVCAVDAATPGSGAAEVAGWLLTLALSPLVPASDPGGGVGSGHQGMLLGGGALRGAGAGGGGGVCIDEGALRDPPACGLAMDAWSSLAEQLLLSGGSEARCACH
jgi:hypothetical protein